MLLSSKQIKQIARWFTNLSKRKYISLLPTLHENAFSSISCLSCAACCKSYSPRFKTPDIKRISKHLKCKESIFINTYLILDEEGDFVAKSLPCPFLNNNNHCSIYSVRPSDCQRFPYTDEDTFLHRAHITLKNASFCPAVVHVLKQIEQIENSSIS